MITYKAIIIPNNRRKDGTYPVKIRVTFKGVSRRLPTSMVCKPGDLNKKKQIRNPDILLSADQLIARMRNVTSAISPFDLENHDVDWVVSQIKKRLSRENFTLDFFEWSDKFLLSKQEHTRKAYISAVNAFGRFLGERRIDINNIHRSLLLDFLEFIDNEPKMRLDRKTGEYKECKVDKIPKSMSLWYLTKLEHIFNAAKDRYNDEDSGHIAIPLSPFSKIDKKRPPSRNGQRNLGQELMQRIISAEVSNPTMRYCLDAFIVSFCLNGANLADLYNAAPVNKIWVYNRQKTTGRRADHAEMRVNVPDELSPYIKRLQSHKGQWWLPTLHFLSKDKDGCTCKINYHLRKWCKENGVPKFTFYAARHTFASLARKAGVEKATVDEMLCHVGDFEMTDIYAERDWDIINKANRKVIELFEW